MSQSPYLMAGARAGLRLGHAQMVDSVIHDGLWDAFNDYHMGITAENPAEKYAISRAEQDSFALRSQQKAQAAQQAGRFEREITPVTVPKPKGEALLVSTTNSRAIPAGAGAAAPGVSQRGHGDRRQRLVAQRRRRRGAADERGKAAALRLPVLAHITGYASSGVDPAIMGIGPAPAAPLLGKPAGGWRRSI